LVWWISFLANLPFVILLIIKTKKITNMAKFFDRITVNPNVCLGEATIRGMRITVAFVLKLIASGMSSEEILVSYPELEKEDLAQAIEYAAWLASERHQPLAV
jgi:uncharacterized protein (DUF433 family)